MDLEGVQAEVARNTASEDEPRSFVINLNSEVLNMLANICNMLLTLASIVQKLLLTKRPPTYVVVGHRRQVVRTENERGRFSEVGLSSSRIHATVLDLKELRLPSVEPGTPADNHPSR